MLWVRWSSWFAVLPSGVNGCQPRAPRFRADHLRKVIAGFLKAKGDPSNLPDNLLCMGRDGGKPGLEDAFSRAFAGDDGRTVEKSKQTTYVIFDEESLNARKSKASGSVNLVQRLHVFTKTPGCVKLERIRG